MKDKIASKWDGFLLWLGKSPLNKGKIPFIIVSSFFLVTLFFWGKTWATVGDAIVKSFKLKIHEFIVTTEGMTVSLVYVICSTATAIIGWLLSTRVKAYRTKRMRIMYFLLLVTLVIGLLTLFGLSRVALYVFPFLQNLLMAAPADSVVTTLAYEQEQKFAFLLMCMPLMAVFFVVYFFLTKFHAHEADLVKKFFEFEWTGKKVQAFSKLEKVDYQPDVELGRDVDTAEMITLLGNDRTLNTNITGPIGTGKSAALGKPILNQDLDHMARFINTFEEKYNDKNYWSKDVSGRYLNGISVIDPSNELCMDVYKLAQAHNIPEEAITYIDPTNPDTPSFNPMRGPVDKVAEVFAQVIAGLSQDSGNDFFSQSARNHLKQYIYLLKEHEPQLEVTFEMLLSMYSNSQIAHKMREKLKARIPADLRQFTNRDERNYWNNLIRIRDWFEKNLVPKTEGKDARVVYNEKSEMVFVDAQEMYVQGLRNTLDDIANNILLNRVMMGKSDFDFDRHLAIGGVLIVNTAKGELEELSRVLGKMILMNLQNATFRRKPNISPYHHIFVDEAPEYLYPAFKSFPAQSRKYKVIITILEQTLAQLEDEYGPTFKTILLATLRNKMFYGDLAGTDAKEFSEMIDEEVRYTEGENEQVVSAIQDNPSSRATASYQREVVQKYSASDLIYQEAFSCAIKIVENNRPMPVRIIKANFVPDHYFEKARIIADDAKLTYWLRIRREYGAKFNTLHEGQNEVPLLDETDIEERKACEELKIPLHASLIQQPLQSIRYDAVSTHSTVIPSVIVQEETKLPVVEQSKELQGMLNQQKDSGKVHNVQQEPIKPTDVPIEKAEINVLAGIVSNFEEKHTDAYADSVLDETQQQQVEELFKNIQK